LILFNLIIYLFNRNYDKLKQRLVNQTFLLVTLLILIIISEIFLHVAMLPFWIYQTASRGNLTILWCEAISMPVWRIRK
jgi:hypothetical protein